MGESIQLDKGHGYISVVKQFDDQNKQISRFFNTIFVAESCQPLEKLTDLETIQTMSVDLDGLTFDLLYQPANSDTLFVFLANATDRNTLPVPQFARFTYGPRYLVNGHCLCISDPTLNLDKELSLEFW